jgi:hypothetical protein
VLALTQTIEKKFDAKTHVDAVEGLKSQLREREGIVYLKRLTIILDEDSEKGFGLVRTLDQCQYIVLECLRYTRISSHNGGYLFYRLLDTHFAFTINDAYHLPPTHITSTTIPS